MREGGGEVLKHICLRPLLLTPSRVLIDMHTVFLGHTVSAHFQGSVDPSLLYVMILKPFLFGVLKA